MFGRVVLALISTPAYGLGVALAALPVTLICYAILGAFGVTAILLPLLLLVVAFLVQVTIYVQTARYAASFTGLKKFEFQPDFFGAIGKGFMVSFIGQILYTLAVVAVTLVFLEYRGGEALWWLNPTKLISALEVGLRQPDRLDGIFSFEGFDLAGLMEAVRISYMLYMTAIAIFIVPMACGVSWGNERSYTLGLVLVRFLIAMPCLAAVVGIVGHWIVFALDFAISSVWEKFTIQLFVRHGVELVLFAGMIFSFEALMLRTGKEQEADEAELERAGIEVDRDGIRALRQARMNR